jgi:hypothetical protein
MIKIILPDNTVAIHYNLYTVEWFLMVGIYVCLVVEILFVTGEREK